MKYKSPICTLNGFMSHNIIELWKSLNNCEYNGNRSLINIESGGISSVFDTAVSAFYFLKGGRVNYGLTHAIKHKHSQFGIIYKGNHEIIYLRFVSDLVVK